MSTKTTELGIDFAERLGQREMIDITGLITPSGPIENNPNFTEKAVWSEASVFAGRFIVYYVRLEDGRILATNQESATSEHVLIIHELLDSHARLKKVGKGPALTVFQACFMSEESPIEEWRIDGNHLRYREIDPEWKHGCAPPRRK